MTKRILELISWFVVSLSLSCTFCNADSKEKIIQEEKMSFERCLEVISISEDKLSIAPEIFERSSQERIAVFSLSDGVLTITCDGQNDLVTVSTRLN